MGITAVLHRTNQCLQDINQSLGPLHDWTTEGNIHEDTKKWFGAAISDACSARSLDKIVLKLRQVADTAKGAETARLSASSTKRPSDCSSRIIEPLSIEPLSI